MPAVHNWGASNRVFLDKCKEEFAILDPMDGHGKVFKFLGPTIESKLTKEDCIEKINNKAKPKARRILRSRRFFSTSDLVMQFKAHVWGIVESSVPTIYHAAPSSLAKINGIQTFFLQHLDADEKQGFLFGLALLVLRRDVGMLSVLYKCAHGTALPRAS